MRRSWLLVVVVVIVAVAGWNLATYTVPQWEQAIVVQLGEPVRTVQEPGLYFKLPLVQDVLYFDKRLLAYDAAPKAILTKDKQQLVVDNFSRWRIRDPLQFYRTVRDEAGAQSRLDDVIYSIVRENLGRHTLREIVNEQRSALMAEVTKQSDEKARDYGIEVTDVRIKRADLPEKNELNVFDRMRTERERQAKKFRAEGDEEARKIRSQSDKDVQILTAEARKQAEITRGEGDGKATAIYNDAYGRDPTFFDFYRSMQALSNGLTGSTTTYVGPATGDFFRYFGVEAGKPPASTSPPPTQ